MGISKHYLDIVTFVLDNATHTIRLSPCTKTVMISPAVRDSEIDIILQDAKVTYLNGKDDSVDSYKTFICKSIEDLFKKPIYKELGCKILK